MKRVVKLRSRCGRCASCGFILIGKAAVHKLSGAGQFVQFILKLDKARLDMMRQEFARELDRVLILVGRILAERMIVAG